MSELAAFLGVSVGGTIPAIRFFGPRPRFIQYMAANYKGTLLYEIGAGAGNVARALADSGLTITALDLYHQDFEEFPMPRGSLQNRPRVDVSKPATESGLRQVLFYPAEVGLGKVGFDFAVVC